MLFRHVACIVIVFINTSVIAQHSREQQNTAQIQKNDKSLFLCDLGVDKRRSSKRVPLILASKDLLGYRNFTSTKKIRLAVVATGEYSQYHLKKANAIHLSETKQKQIVLKAIRASVFNVNKVLIRDLSVELLLVEGSEKLVFLDPETDGLSGDNTLILIRELTHKINTLIGVNNYDIGHGFSTIYGGLSSQGNAFTNRKAQGVTGAEIPEGKTFDIDFFTHEIGHQIGATHTQNSNCRRNSNSSIEPGSGSTIMGYAGICRVSNSSVTLDSKPYFNSFNVLQIEHFLKPHFHEEQITANYGLEKISNYKIPRNTPFEVRFKSIAPKEAKILYSCNQIDKEFATFPPKTRQKKGPVFSPQDLSVKRSFYFPELKTVLNQNLNSKRGVLSSVSREYNFLASARIKYGEKNLTSMRKFQVEVINARPFKITSQNKKGIIWEPNEERTIVWDVGSSKTMLEQDFVEILLSDNNGKSFDYILKKKTHNDGIENIKVPKGVVSNQCRIKIKPLKSIFYAINEYRFSITPFHEVDYDQNQEKEIGLEMLSEIYVDRFINYEDLEVSLTINYKDISELQISLANPMGNEVLLWDQNCSKGTHLNLRFSDISQDSEKEKLDNKARSVCDAVVVGLNPPVETLKKLQGNTNGVWKLKVKNLSREQKIGKLNHWGLHFRVKGNNIKNDISNREKVKIFPNPVNEIMNVQFTENPKNSMLQVFSVSGELKKALRLNSKTIQQVLVNDLEKGVYFVTIITNNTFQMNTKIIIE